MAELLIKAIDHTHTVPEKDRRGCYKRGDVVVVMPDGHEWGRKEGPPKFQVVKIPDAVLADLRYLQDEQHEDDDRNVTNDTYRRRAHTFDFGTLPPGVITAIEKGIPVNLSAVQSAMKRKRDGRTHAQRGNQ